MTALHELSTFGFDPSAELRALARLPVSEQCEYLLENVAYHASETAFDRPVSDPLRYRINHVGKLQYVNSSGRETPIHLDVRERGGLYDKGYERVTTQLATSSPDSFVFYYSPKGPSSFDDDPNSPFTHVGRYGEGALYIFYHRGDGEYVGTAVKIGDEQIVTTMLSRNGLPLPFAKNETESYIAHYITQPVKLDARAFILHTLFTDEELGKILYTDTSGRSYTTKAIVKDVLKSLCLNRRDDVSREIANSSIERVMKSRVGTHGDPFTEDEVREVYLRSLLGAAERLGTPFIELRGSCGGSVVGVMSILAELTGSTLGKNARDISDPNSSISRLFNALFSSRTAEGKYTWGKCRCCGAKKSDVGECGICRHCERTGAYKKISAPHSHANTIPSGNRL